jgi:RNA polymerase sigma-70 factor (ECF subfamily)
MAPYLDGPSAAQAIRAGEPRIMAAVVDAYLAQVLRAARGAGLGPVESEEVTQETFTTFFEVAPRFEGRSHVRTFLFGILYRKISEARRARSRESRHDPIDEVVESRFAPDGSWLRPPDGSDRLLEAHELRRALSECLEGSPLAQRMAFYLREVEGLSTEEICKILDVSATNLGVMIYRLRNRTRECLETKDVETPC